jgi:ubiquitin C-terminal hydrolase
MKPDLNLKRDRTELNPQTPKPPLPQTPKQSLPQTPRETLSSNEQPVTKGVTTLINMGNTCFMNSALQCLMHTTPFVDYFHKCTIIKCSECNETINLLKMQTPSSNNDPNIRTIYSCHKCQRPIDLRDNPFVNPNYKNESLAIEFAKAVRSLTIGYWEENCRVQPETFYRVFAACLDKIFNTEVFRLGDQQDSQECLVYILDLLHMGLSKEVNIIIRNENANDAPHLAWKNFLKKNNHSFLSDTVYGLTRTSVECQDCKTVSKRFDPTNFLSLSFPPSCGIYGPKATKLISLEDMLRFYSHPEFLTDDNKYSCDKCKADFEPKSSQTQEQEQLEKTPQTRQKYQGSDAKKKIELWMLPEILIVDFKRYKVSMVKYPNGQVGMRRTKINTLVRCPFNIDFTEFLPNQIVNGPINNAYELYAVIYHSGSLQGGHYVSACKVENRGWVKFDDARFEDISEETVVNSLIYSAFYRRVKKN